MNIIYPKRNIVILNNNEIKQVKGGCYCFCKEKEFVGIFSSENICRLVCSTLKVKGEMNKCVDGNAPVSILDNPKGPS